MLLNFFNKFQNKTTQTFEDRLNNAKTTGGSAVAVFKVAKNNLQLANQEIENVLDDISAEREIILEQHNQEMERLASIDESLIKERKSNNGWIKLIPDPDAVITE